MPIWIGVGKCGEYGHRKPVAIYYMGYNKLGPKLQVILGRLLGFLAVRDSS